MPTSRSKPRWLLGRAFGPDGSGQWFAIHLTARRVDEIKALVSLRNRIYDDVCEIQVPANLASITLWDASGIWLEEISERLIDKVDQSEGGETIEITQKQFQALTKSRHLINTCTGIIHVWDDGVIWSAQPRHSDGPCEMESPRIYVSQL